MGNISSFLQQTLANSASTFSATFTGPFTSSQVLTVSYQLIGSFLSFDIPAVAAAAAVGTIAVATATTAIPAALRPTADISKPILAKSNSLLLNVPGKIVCQTTGTILIYVDMLETGLFAATGNNGWQRLNVSYNLF